MKKVLYILASIALIVAAGFKLMSNKQKQAEETAIIAQQSAYIAVRATTVKSEVIQPDYHANGNFAPLQDLKLASERGGRVVQVLVQEGAKVSVGQALAIIKADLQSVELQNAEAAYLTAQKDAQRFENAFTSGGVTQQQLDQIKLQLQAAKARYNQAKINVGDSYVRSTINGIINKRHIEPGTVVGAGTALFDIVNVSKLKLKVNVSESQVATIKVGDPVKIKASVYPDKEFSGKITFVAAMADQSLNFPVEIEVTNNPEGSLRAGMYGSALFTPAQKSQTPALIIPRSAFVGSVSNNQVFTVNDQKAKLTKIVSGRVWGDTVEILDGLKDGDTVITSGIINLTDGATIKIIE